VGRKTVHLQCTDGTVRLEGVQPAGKKVMAAADWGRGLPEDARFLTGPEGAR
jgi:methionyl-tRNA formyltransferase